MIFSRASIAWQSCLSQRMSTMERSWRGGSVGDFQNTVMTKSHKFQSLLEMLGFLYSWFADQGQPKSVVQKPKHCHTTLTLFSLVTRGSKTDFHPKGAREVLIFSTNEWHAWIIGDPSTAFATSLVGPTGLAKCKSFFLQSFKRGRAANTFHPSLTLRAKISSPPQRQVIESPSIELRLRLLAQCQGFFYAQVIYWNCDAPTSPAWPEGSKNSRDKFLLLFSITGWSKWT